VSGGVVSFIEGDFADSKWATEWSDQVLFKYPYLDCSMVVYSTSMENDYERFERGGEALWAKVRVCKVSRSEATTSWLRMHEYLHHFLCHEHRLPPTRRRSLISQVNYLCT
jgi:hypothetical protein